MKEFEVLIVKEKTAFQSIISDVFTFGCLFGGFFINYHYLGNSAILKLFIVATSLFVFYLISRRRSKSVLKMTPPEALEFLTKTVNSSDEGERANEPEYK